MGNAVKKALRELNGSNGSTMAEIIEKSRTFPPEEIPNIKSVKTYLKMAVDVHILQVNEAKRYSFYVKKTGSKKNKRKRPVEETIGDGAAPKRQKTNQD